MCVALTPSKYSICVRKIAFTVTAGVIIQVHQLIILLNWISDDFIILFIVYYYLYTPGSLLIEKMYINVRIACNRGDRDIFCEKKNCPIKMH